MEIDFSSVNLQYLLQVRDLARENPQRASVLFDMPDELAHLLAELPPGDLTAINQIRIPLVVPRHEPWWWSRLFRAIHARQPEEVQAVLEHVGMVISR